jgi:hypothetical protein
MTDFGTANNWTSGTADKIEYARLLRHRG